jgi:hypothetical protein
MQVLLQQLPRFLQASMFACPANCASSCNSVNFFLLR